MANPRGNPDTAIKPGQALNPEGGRTPIHRFKRMFGQSLRALAKEPADPNPFGDIDKMDELARVCWAMAKQGDLGAIKEIADRVDGKVIQPQVVSGDSKNPVVHKHILAFTSGI